jgi:hypothetical protein
MVAAMSLLQNPPVTNVLKTRFTATVNELKK